jgi:SAM-dependent methyltransferase
MRLTVQFLEKGAELSRDGSKLGDSNHWAVDPMNDARRLQRAHTFDEIAELYDRARRECQDQLFDDLFNQAGIEPIDANVLEVGCGTGQATIPLARRGCRVVCVEMGANLVRIARRKLRSFARVEVIHGRFEEWKPSGVFDIVLAVNSWHWLDPSLRYATAAAVLRPDGVLAITIRCQAFPPGFDPIFAEIHECYQSLGEANLAWPPLPPDELPDLCDEIKCSGYFDDVRVTRRVWEEELTADEYLELMSTASDHRLMDPEKRDRLFAEMRCLITARPGGCIRNHNLTILHVAFKKG